MVKEVKTAEDVFDHLKSRNEDFKTWKLESEFKYSWPNFKQHFLSDPDLVKWLESQIDDCNLEKSKNISEAQLNSEKCAKARKKLAIIGTKNFKKATSDPEHQSNASKKGNERRLIINAERREQLLEFITNRLPNEFGDNDIISIIENNKDNTLFMRSHRSKIPMKYSNIISNYLEIAKDRNIIVLVIKGYNNGKTKRDRKFHIINTVNQVKNPIQKNIAIEDTVIEDTVIERNNAQSTTLGKIVVNYIYN